MMQDRHLAHLPSRRQTLYAIKAPPGRQNSGVVRIQQSEPRNATLWFWEAIVKRNAVAICNETRTIEEKTSPCVSTVLQKTLETNGNSQAVYPVLETHAQLLDERFAQRLRSFAIAILPVLSSEQAVEFATVLVNFSSLMWEFPQGRRTSNIEIAIACCETALPMLPCETDFSQVWAKTHNNLALAYSERLRGDRTSNLGRAFSHYQKASQIFIRQPFPQQWSRLPIHSEPL